MYFSNSLIIHEDKTKEITTVKEVWICDPNYHKNSVNFCFEFLQELLTLWEAISNTQKNVSSHIQTLWSWFKKTWLNCLVFSTHFSGFGHLMKHSSLCLIYYIYSCIIIPFNTFTLLTKAPDWLCQFKSDFYSDRKVSQHPCHIIMSNTHNRLAIYPFDVISHANLSNTINDTPFFYSLDKRISCSIIGYCQTKSRACFNNWYSFLLSFYVSKNKVIQSNLSSKQPFHVNSVCI